MLSISECKEIIQNAESIGFFDKGNVTMTRLMQDDPKLVESLLSRIKAYIPEEVNMTTALSYGKSIKMIGLNERLRCGRYTNGEYFWRHTDTQYMPQFQIRSGFKRGQQYSCSALTVMVYLNSQVEVDPDIPTFSGGATQFVQGSRIKHSVVPEAGMAIIFTQAEPELTHEGEVVTDGKKYMLRTDVMYEWTWTSQNY